MSEPTTPLMRQYAAIKKQHPNALVFFRLGDFYELFYEDAVVAARELQITLTSRNKEKDQAIPMCGVPYHAAENYMAKLLRKGFKVALCEQMEDPQLAKKLVRREVTRVLTPGTVADSSLAASENNFLAAMARNGDKCGMAALDLSTGDFRATEFTGPHAERRVLEELQQLSPREVLFPSTLSLFEEPKTLTDRMSASGTAISDDPSEGTQQDQIGDQPLLDPSRFHFTETPLEDWAFSPDYAIPLVENQFGVLSLEGFGLAGRTAASCAAGAILHYLKNTQKGALEHIDRIGFYERQNALVLDAVTVRNLELVEPLFAHSARDQEANRATLFHTMDSTLTPMGKRLLRAWMLRPSVDVSVIQSRLDAVENAHDRLIEREEMRRSFDGVLDIERLLSRVTLETANPRDLLALSSSFARLPGIKQALKSLSEVNATARWQDLDHNIDPLEDVRLRIETTLADHPPLTLNDGGVIRDGFDSELDQLRDLSRNSKQYIAQIEERERIRTGIGSLKVKFNSIFGYYLEVSKANLQHVPQEYERKQTLINAERFTTPELKQYESKVLDAQDKMIDIERRLFTDLRSAIASNAKRIRQTSLALAEADLLAAFAHLASQRGYKRPKLQPEGTNELEILGGRHPVIEHLQVPGGSRFVPNDLYLDNTSHRVVLLTGPNMGGKSTYLRQSALICIMAQVGSFVPAERARLPVLDRIFTRIGAADDLARGRSTFMVEMTETAAILHTATPRSLVLLDEMGRGTATYDGLALAWAAIEYLHDRTRAFTLFATHYHELTELSEQLAGVKNCRVTVREAPSGIVFLRKVEPGAADRSYGIEVARLAGLPNEVIVRAREVLTEHESTAHLATEHLAHHSQSEEAASGKRDHASSKPAQITMFTPLSQLIVDRLRSLDVNKLTPLEALQLLDELKKQLE